MEFLLSSLGRHFAGKPVVASGNVGCFLRLPLVKPVISLQNLPSLSITCTPPPHEFRDKLESKNLSLDKRFQWFIANSRKPCENASADLKLLIRLFLLN